MDLYTEELGNGITLIDTGLYRPRCGAAYLVVENGRAAFIEPGPPPALDKLMAVLAQKEIPPENVDYVIVTHIHLDHAGVTGALLQKLPNAKVVAHPQGIPHLVDPARLEESSREVYGEAYDQHFGALVPVPADRCIEAQDRVAVMLDNRVLRMLDAPGHSRSHIAVMDETSRGLFSGDAFGISYRETDTPHGVFIFPATTPTQFDPAACHQTIDRLAALTPSWLYLTHFGAVPFNRLLADDLHRQLDRIRALSMSLARYKTDEERAFQLRNGLMKIFTSRLSRLECPLTRDEVQQVLEADMELNIRGLLHWQKRLETRSGPHEGGGRRWN
ncbi:MAG: MBL fold metallo-hydrolase [Magnetococcales bacterium]|nr:MBL fold metallo-hydrolase [Magnetococcales bacterium]